MSQGEVLTTGTIDGYQALGAFGQPVHRSYVQLRATIEQRLGPRHANFFARPQLDERTRQIRWISPVAGPARRWLDLGPDEQAEVALDLAILRAGFQRCLDDLGHDSASGATPGGGAAFAAVLAQALQTPNDAHLHLVGDQPVATFWGFSEYQRPGFDVLGLAPAAPVAALVAPAVVAAPRRLWWLWLLALLALLALLFLAWWFWPRPAALPVTPPQAATPKPGQPLAPEVKPEIKPEPKPEPIIRDRRGAILDRGKVVIDRDGVVTDRQGRLVGRIGPDGVLVPGDDQPIDPALLLPEGAAKPGETPADAAQPDGNKPETGLTPDGKLPDPDPTKSDPALPDPAKPDAAKPDTGADPNKPEPANPDPTKPDPLKPEGTAPDPAKPDATKPDGAGTDPTKPDPTNPDPTGQIPPPPKPDLAPGAAPPLAIPDAPGSTGAAPGLGFVQGRWRSQSGLVDQSTGRQLDQTYEFDDKGQGTAVVRRSDGVECRAPAQAVMQDGKLQVQELDNLRCSDGQAFEKSTTVCERDAAGRTRCRGANAGGTGFDVRIERAKP